ncbi:TonB-dependent receptor [Caulobacter sp. KR2-114]|uniref:TonB-dependent receptor n=1 Tax=Caulobacter sp. KR2-114 TaxID=3400912 RepID=UPI003BFD3436
MRPSKLRLRHKLIASTYLLAAGAAAPGLAHAADAAAAATAANDSTVEQIVVTAERRSVDIQKSALAVTAVTSAALDKSATMNISGLNAVVPSLEITKASGFENLVTIRGVGSATPENSLTTTPGVSFFMDGVYIANTVSLDQSLFDVDQIEVLRGPQGALYGQSSIGGAIILNTKQPKLHTFDASGDFSAGTYGLFRERAEVNIPLGDQFAARLSVQKFDHSGFTRDVAIPGFYLDAAHDVSGKAALLWKPRDDFQVTFTGQWYHSSQAGDAQKNILDPNPDPRAVSQDYPGHFQLNTQLYHVNAQWDLPWFQVRSVTAYQVLDHVQQEDGDRSTYAILGRYDHIAAWNTWVGNFTQEIDLVSKPGGKLDWVVGGFYLNQRSHQFVAEYGAFAPPPVLTIPSNIESSPPSNLSYGNDSHAVHQSYAGFAQGTYHVSDRFRLTAGVRVNADYNKDPSFNFSAFGTSHVENKSWDVVPTWRAVAEYDVTPTNMVYGSVSKGYKPGGVNGSYNQQVIPTVFKPETNTSFEIGSKNTFFDHALRLNATAFYYIHKNFQYIETDPVPFDGGIANIPEVHDYGAEFEASYVGMEGRFHLDASLALEKGTVSSHYKSIDSTVADSLEGPNFTGANSQPFFGPCSFYGAYGNPACWAAVEAAAIDLKGHEAPAMPNVSGSISASYRFDMFGGDFTPRAELVYRGKEWARFFNEPGLDRVPAYTIVNLNFEYVPKGNDHIKFQLAVTNVGDKAGINSRYTDPYGVFQTSDQYIPPRQVIGTVAYKW